RRSPRASALARPACSRLLGGGPDPRQTVTRRERNTREPGMTEQEWLAGDTGVLYMLWHVTDTLRLKRSRSGRPKLRLVGCGCCRLLWDRLDEPRRAVVTMIERVADDERNKAELEAARRRCLELFAETKRGTADELRALSDNLLSAVACDKAYPAAFSMTTL